MGLRRIETAPVSTEAHRRSNGALTQLQPWKAGGLLVSNVRCSGVNHLSTSFLAVPSVYMSVIALLTALQVFTSPFLTPTPYFSSVNGTLSTFTALPSRAA